ncbi:MAG: recombination protein RecR [Clostridia bacterium]|nr:recombination protein RecR [Clostridia bacterium]
MDYIPKPIEALALELGRLPSIGPKSAMRLAYHIASGDKEQAKALANAVYEANTKIRKCCVCGNISDDERCFVCKDGTRDKGVICVVSNAKDIVAIEKTHEFNGLYHVLGGSISPMLGIGPDDIDIKGLIARLDGINEVILATNTDVEGEATASYIYRLINQSVPKVSRIAHGVPVGGNLEYTDEVTIIKAFENRTSL